MVNKSKKESGKAIFIIINLIISVIAFSFSVAIPVSGSLIIF